MELEREHPGVKQSMLKALGNVAPRHLLDTRLNPPAELARTRDVDVYRCARPAYKFENRRERSQVSGIGAAAAFCAALESRG